MVAASYLCTNCNGKTYNYSKDLSFEKIGKSDTLKYGTAAAKGFYSNNLVCSSPSIVSCLAMDILIMTQQSGFDKISGIVGMSTGYGNDTGPLLIQ